MDNMRKVNLLQSILSTIPLVIMLFIVACKKVDLSPVEGKIDSLEMRLEALEKKVASINSSIETLNEAILKLQAKVYVVNVISKDGFHIIKFTDGTMLEIRSGNNGKDAPVFGVKKDIDGRYYWTVTVDGSTEWLLDGKGKMLPVSGKDGKDGQDGADGRDRGVDGEMILPSVGIDTEGYWTVSYDNGKTFKRIEDSEGKFVKAVAEASGTVDSIFKSIKDYEDRVAIFMIDGTSITLDKFKDMSLAFSVADSLKIVDNSAVISFEIKGDATGAKVETVEKGSLISYVEMKSTNKGEIKVIASGPWEQGDAILALLCNDKHTVTYVIPVAKYIFSDQTNDPEKEIDIPEGMDKYIPIFKGSNPPVLNGAYLMEPNTCVFCSDEGNGGYSQGTVCVSEIFQFSNMSKLTRTIDVRNESVDGHTYEEGLGYYISGEGNNFTIYANVDGKTSDGISTKMSYIISGTLTADGIKDFYNSFIMQWKSAAGNLMSEGAFRVFKDSLAVPTQWKEYTKGAYPMMTNGAFASKISKLR